ncbi:cation transporter [Cyanobium sp. ATX 6A2]|nr:cation diffusion facilitator family transporter [Cyanobium sp. ATX 6A2]MCP9886411.1 cation transporter [Cyanobium sp. ATX 6A2]
MSPMFRSARSYITLSIGAAAATIVLKLAAWRITGSVGLFSDALESGVNLVAALAGFWALTLAAKPPDREHPYGHFKAEYFASGLESALILVAAAAIAVTALGRMLAPEPLEQVGVGLALSLVASGLNALVAWLLLGASRRFHSITLRADAQHLLTDVWTSLGVVAAVALVQLTGQTILDPLIAIAVALNIVVMGWKLLRETASGLLDQAWPDAEQRQLEALLAPHIGEGLAVHAMRTRVAGSRRFVAFHLLVPGHWSVQRGHDLCELLEREITAALPRTDVITHLEPIDDPRSWQDGGFSWDDP